LSSTVGSSAATTSFYFFFPLSAVLFFFVLFIAGLWLLEGTAAQINIKVHSKIIKNV